MRRKISTPERSQGSGANRHPNGNALTRRLESEVEVRLAKTDEKADKKDTRPCAERLENYRVVTRLVKSHAIALVVVVVSFVTFLGTNFASKSPAVVVVETVIEIPGKDDPKANAAYFLKPRLVSLSNDGTTRDDVSRVGRSILQSTWSEIFDPPTRTIELSSEEITAQLDLLDSEEYSKKPEPMYTEDPPCEPQYPWQENNNPVCNILHELDMTDFLQFRSNGNGLIEKFRFLASGGYRDVYEVFRDFSTQGETLALKTLKWSREFQERHYDRHRRDAVAADRLTAVTTSVNIFGYCGNSAIYEFAKGGNLKQAVENFVIKETNSQDAPAWNSTKKLNVAYQVASALADVHNVDQEGRPSIAHTDIR